MRLRTGAGLRSVCRVCRCGGGCSCSIVVGSLSAIWNLGVELVEEGHICTVRVPRRQCDVTYVRGRGCGLVGEGAKDGFCMGDKQLDRGKTGLYSAQ